MVKVMKLNPPPVRTLFEHVRKSPPKLWSARLSDMDFFDGVHGTTLKRLRAVASWYCVPGGTTLFSAGDDADAAYFLLSGGLVAHRTGRDGEEQVLGHIAPGEPIGEMALLSDGVHRSSVTALRDCEVLRLERAEFEALLERDAALSAHIARIVLRRLRGPDEDIRSLPRVFAIISTSPSIDLHGFARTLSRKLSLLGVRARAISEGEVDPNTPLWRYDEQGHDIVLLTAQMNEEGWYRFCLRQADRVWVLAREDARPSTPMPLTPSPDAPRRRFHLVDVVMVSGGRAPASRPRDWIEATGANRVFRWHNDADLGRLARIAAGLTVGLVLSGGGARAYAHLGAIRALREAGIPFDFLGGSSMGAIIAGGLALGWSCDELEQRVWEAFVSSNPLGDFQLPVISFARGQRVDERLHTHFGEARIEETQRPFFVVSSDLTEGQTHVHRTGMMRDALRASIALPGILPPVVMNDSVLVDGAVFDNFPADVMEGMHRAFTLGVDVSRNRGLPADDFRERPNFWQWVWRFGFSAAPPIVSLLLRAASVHTAPLTARERADAVILPKLEGVDIRDWTQFGPSKQAGYEAAQAFLAECPPGLEEIRNAVKKVGG